MGFLKGQYTYVTAVNEILDLAAMKKITKSKRSIGLALVVEMVNDSLSWACCASVDVLNLLKIHSKDRIVNMLLKEEDLLNAIVWDYLSLR